MTRTPHVLLGIYLAICLLSLVWPGAELAGGRIEPYVFGLPFSLAWYAGWSVMTFLALFLYHRVTGGGEETAGKETGGEGTGGEE